MRKQRANASHKAKSARTRSRSSIFSSALIIAVIALGVFFVAQSSLISASGANAPAPLPKPQGTVTSHPPIAETWTVARGLPTNVMRLAFSASNPTLGYAAAFVDKQTQDIYTTADGGTNRQKVGTVHAPVGDYLSTNPHDPRDVVMLSVYAPTPGTYTFERSYDGGRTWAQQSLDLPTTGMVSQIGWANTTFLVSFQLDGQLQGSSAVVAFPRGQGGTHLDANGKLNGEAIAHVTALTTWHGQIAVWGSDDSATPSPIGLATPGVSKGWTSLSSTVTGEQYTPTVVTDDGSVLVAQSADHKHIAVSSDSGDTWTTQPDIADGQPSEATFVAPTSKTIIVVHSDGTYALSSGRWNKVSSKQVAFVSDGGAQHMVRLWSQNAQGQVIWFDA